MAGKGYYYYQNPQVGVLFKYLLLGRITEPKPKALQCMLPRRTQDETGWSYPLKPDFQTRCTAGFVFSHGVVSPVTDQYWY